MDENFIIKQDRGRIHNYLKIRLNTDMIFV